MKDPQDNKRPSEQPDSDSNAKPESDTPDTENKNETTQLPDETLATLETKLVKPSLTDEAQTEEADDPAPEEVGASTGNGDSQADTNKAAQDAYPTETVNQNLEDDDVRPNMGILRPDSTLVVREQRSGKVFRFPVKDIDEITIGRRSTSTHHLLQIDLSDLIEPEDGISRRHASLIKQNNLLFVVDRDSRNGTFLNGQKLIPEQLRIVRDSDMIRVGRIVLNVSYTDLEDSASKVTS